MTEHHKHHDLYKILKVKKDATQDEIRTAFMKAALKCHPDKAPMGKTAAETEAIKKSFETDYADLQRAYKILSNPKARDQYNQTLQNTFVDLRGGTEREVHYKKSKEYTKIDEEGKRVFDNEKFSDAFNKTRSAVDSSGFQKLHGQYNRTDQITLETVNQLVDQRKKELDSVKVDKVLYGEGAQFDANAFNRMFDHMKMTNPTSCEVQPYGEEPAGLFSGSKGLVEDSNLGGVSMNYGETFGNVANVGNFVTGASVNPTKELDLSQFRGDPNVKYVSGSNVKHADANYGRTNKISDDVMKKRLEAIQADRDRLMNLGEHEFTVVQSEIEKQYSELFENNTSAVEGIASKKHKKTKPVVVEKK